MDGGLSGNMFSYDQPELPGPLAQLAGVETGVGGLQTLIHHHTGQDSRLEPRTPMDLHPEKYSPSLDLDFLTGLLAADKFKGMSPKQMVYAILAGTKSTKDATAAANAVVPNLDPDDQDNFIVEFADETGVLLEPTMYQQPKIGARDDLEDDEDDFDDDMGLVPIGGGLTSDAVQEAVRAARLDVRTAKGNLDNCLGESRAQLKTAKRNLKTAISKRRRARLRGLGARAKKAGLAALESQREESEIPTTTLSLRATGIMGKGEQLTKTDIGDAFHGVALGFGEKHTEIARQIASNFVGHRFGIDTEDDRMVDIKPDGSRIIKAVVGRTEDGTPVAKGVLKMESWGFNDNLSHTVSTVGSDVGKVVSNGDTVDEGGFVLTVIGDMVELAGSYGAENKDSHVPKGTKIYHGHIVIGQKDDETPAMVLLVRTMDPVRSDSSKDGALTYKMMGDHLLHRGDPVEITRKISTATKNGKKTVTVSTDIKSSS